MYDNRLKPTNNNKKWNKMPWIPIYWNDNSMKIWKVLQHYQVPKSCYYLKNLNCILKITYVWGMHSMPYKKHCLFNRKYTTKNVLRNHYIYVNWKYNLFTNAVKRIVILLSHIFLGTEMTRHWLGIMWRKKKTITYRQRISQLCHLQIIAVVTESYVYFIKGYETENRNWKLLLRNRLIETLKLMSFLLDILILYTTL